MKILGIPIGAQPLQTETIKELVDKVMKHPDNAVFKNELQKAAKRDPVKVLTTIVQYQHQQYQKEVAHWKVARAEAMDVYNPRRVMLTDLYEDIELDAFIHGIVHNKRIFKISNKPFKIVNKAGEEQKDKTALLSHQWFNDFLKLAMQSRFYGYSLVYFWDWKANGEVGESILVPRRHVIPQKRVWTKMQYDITGFDYTKPPYNSYMIGIGKEDDLGLYEKAALLYILKKHSWQSWDEFEERFGIPIPIVKTATGDKKVLDSIESWLRDLSTGSYGIVPEGGELEIVETGKTDSYQVFYRKIELAQKELEILFTGQIRETNLSGTYGKEKVKDDEAQELINDDKTFIANMINDKLIPLLRANGYPFTDEESFDWNDGAKATPADRLAIFKGVKELGFKLNKDQVSEELDVIIDGEDEEEVDETETDPKKPKDKKGEPTNSIEALHVKINSLYHNVQ